MMKKTTLTTSEIEALLRKRPEWKLGDGKLTREWTFGNFVEAIAFVNRVAPLAEAAGHHPDIDIRYNRVLLSLVSHDAGGITEHDAALVSQISEEFAD